MNIEVTAPTRIDLAGGTLDIWPIYLMLNSPVTINFAINVFATVKLTNRDDKKINIRSLDSDEEVKALSISKLENSEVLPLPINVIKYFRPESGFNLEMESKSPRGAGIGGSSTLLIALLSAFSKFCKKKIKQEDLIRLARDMECNVIKVPAGIQDYYPPLLGGVNAIHLLQGETKIEKIKLSMRELSQRVVLLYTGQPRNSGINNWDITKKFIDGDKQIRKLLQKIATVSNFVHRALINKQFNDIGKLIAQEWEYRLELAPGISTPVIKKVLDAGLKAGAEGGKVCGAGGGGCLFLYCKPDRKNEVSKAAISAGGKLINFDAVEEGVIVKDAN